MEFEAGKINCSENNIKELNLEPEFDHIIHGE